ncbi:MAG: beta-ketoacyl-[acyl-carrier-protein] synthase family protein [Planctomycetota bacterium]
MTTEPNADTPLDNAPGRARLEPPESRPDSRRVVITGMGWVTPLGARVDSAWSKLLAGAGAVGPIHRYDAATFGTNFAAEVKGFDIEHFLDDPDVLRTHERAGVGSQFALASVAQAWEQAGLGTRNGRPSHNVDPRRIGLYLGAGEGSLDYDNYIRTNLDTWDADRRDLSDRFGPTAMALLDPRTELEQDPHATIAHVASLINAQGPAFNCMTACAAGCQAIGEAGEIIKRGDADIMVAGGSHSMIHPLGMTGFIRLTAMSTRRDDPATAARPFDQTRDGFAMGEGAGIVVLESLEHAHARGAIPLAELAGYGSSADAFRVTDMHPDGKGPATAMAAALRHAGVDPHAARSDGPLGPRGPIDYISAHGTGTKENDSIETKAIKSVFGPQSPNVPVSSIKSMMGHLIQAAGVVEIIACVQAIRTGLLPPTINVQHQDPACDLDVVPNNARDLRHPETGESTVELCLSNSFGFGGQNDSVVIRKITA